MCVMKTLIGDPWKSAGAAKSCNMDERRVNVGPLLEKVDLKRLGTNRAEP